MPHTRPAGYWKRAVTRAEFRRYVQWRQGSVFACWLVVFAVIIIGILIVATASLFKVDNGSSSSSSSSGNTDRFVRFPEVEINEEPGSGGLVYIGSRYDRVRHRTVEGYICVIYHSDSPRARNTTRRNHGTGACTDPFATGARWKAAQQFVIDAKNNQGLSETFFFGAVWRAMREIDSKLDFRLYGRRNSTTEADGPDLDSPDGKNEIQFGFVNNPDIVAFNVLWGVFAGPVAERELVESDVLFSLRFPWGDAHDDTGVMDVEAIGVHELMHGAGFGHVSLADASMFPTASLGETKKKTLLECEIEGVCQHYDEHDMCPGHNSTGTVPPRIGAGEHAHRAHYLLLALLICASVFAL